MMATLFLILLGLVFGNNNSIDIIRTTQSKIIKNIDSNNAQASESNRISSNFTPNKSIISQTNTKRANYKEQQVKVLNVTVNAAPKVFRASSVLSNDSLKQGLNNWQQIINESIKGYTVKALGKSTLNKFRQSDNNTIELMDTDKPLIKELNATDSLIDNKAIQTNKEPLYSNEEMDDYDCSMEDDCEFDCED